MSDDQHDPTQLPDDDRASNKAQDDAGAWLAWLRQLTALGSALSVLATAEMRLAGGDLRRLLLLGLFFFPVVIFTWLGLSLFVSWLSYSLSGLPGAGFFTFFVIQVIAALTMRHLFKKYRRSLSMPMTRKYLAEIVEDIKRGP
ncbi:MAG: hypothetical protein WD071_13705 [Pseudohongiella sp.]|uniref:hypothetical protein n=1 Tax=Pseudohongiella sp. TaxID=1979412 RepID=UPI00349FDC24